MTHKLFLSSGGDIETSYAFDELFFCALPLKANILYIPVAMATTMAKKEACFDWFSKLISRHLTKERDIDFSMWNNGDTLPNLYDYDALYVGGGNTYLLVSVLEKTGMLRVVKEYIDDGGIYFGGSAGAVIAGKSLQTVEEENLGNCTDHIGMDLMRGISVFPHFLDNDEQKNRIITINKNNNLKIVALPEGSGLVVGDGTINVYGNAYVYEYEKKTLIYKSWETLK